MDSNLVDCDAPERDLGMCSCAGALGLDILKDVHSLYQERLDHVEKTDGPNKAQFQVQLLRCWVQDLLAQNSLLTRAVEELESDAISRSLERRKHAEILLELRAEKMALWRRMRRKESDLRNLVKIMGMIRERKHLDEMPTIHFYDVTEQDIYGNGDKNAYGRASKTGDAGDFGKFKLDDLQDL